MLQNVGGYGNLPFTCMTRQRADWSQISFYSAVNNSRLTGSLYREHRSQQGGTMPISIFIAIFVVATLAWGLYGYFKGAPHGLGKQGVMCAMTGILGMKKLNRLIAEQQRTTSTQK